jgi:hypothetical protein
MTKPTVRLHISTSGQLIGEADYGDACTARNEKLADVIRSALRDAGYTHATLILDAEESLPW